MNRCSNSRGFSLIEVMVAVLILGVAVTGLVRGITTALASHKDSERLTIAALMAAGQIEFLRADGIISDGTTEGTGSEKLSNYRWRRKITPTSIEGLKEVTVEIEDAESKVKLYELVTQLYDPPLDPLRDKTGVSNTATKERDRRRRGR